jgi:hypothetical protein
MGGVCDLPDGLSRALRSSLASVARPLVFHNKVVGYLQNSIVQRPFLLDLNHFSPLGCDCTHNTSAIAEAKGD